LFTVVHSQEIRDDYAWLKAGNWQEVLKNPAALPADIRDYLVAENAYSACVLAPLAELQATLVAEMRGRLKEDDSSVPSRDGTFSYLTRFRTGEQHPLVIRRDDSEGTETVLLDAEALSQGKPFFQLGPRRHTDDHRLLAWSCDEAGSEFFTIRIRDALRLHDLPDEVPETSGSVVWDSAGHSFLYVRVDANHRARRVYRHVLGTAVSEDALVYEEKQDGWFVHLEESQSGRFCFISISDHETTEVLVLERADLAGGLRLITPRETGMRYEVDHHGDRFVIRTNADGSEDFKLVTAPVEAPGRATWTDLVPHRRGTMILDATCYRDWLVRLERENANPRVVIRHWADGSEHAIAFDEEAYSLFFMDGYEYETDTVRFVYSSMTTPAETFDYDMASRARTLLKRQEVPSGHNPADYVTRRLFAAAPDGEQVPVTLLHRRDLAQDGSAPCLLYGYGAYGFAMPADFDSRALSLVDRGFVWATAHVRGGTEKGWAWYTGGKKAAKPNTFSDFIAVAQMLVDRRYTSPGRIVAQGRSAGGMLMGAVANMAPELFAAVLAEVPFLDVLNTMLDAELPLTPPEWPEWGNPAASREDFDVIRSYSPYDRIEAKPYPAILAIGGLTDPRVTYWEPAKWVAKLRAHMTGGGPVLLKIDMDSGHGGASGRFNRLQEIAPSIAIAIAAVRGQLKT
jgi:oligopeptidase B